MPKQLLKWNQIVRNINVWYSNCKTVASLIRECSKLIHPLLIQAVWNAAFITYSATYFVIAAHRVVIIDYYFINKKGLCRIFCDTVLFYQILIFNMAL